MNLKITIDHQEISKFIPCRMAEIINPIVASNAGLVTSSFGRLQLQEVDAHYFKFLHVVALPERDIIAEITSAVPLLAAIISLQNNFSISSIPGIPNIEIERNKYTIVHAPAFSGTMPFKKGEEYHFLFIHFSEKYVNEFFKYFPPLNDFVCEVRMKAPSILLTHPFSVSNEVQRLIHHLFHMEGISSRELPFYYQNLANEILFQLLKLAAHPELEQIDGPAKLNRARDFAEHNYKRELTIDQIASEIGMSVSSLKNGFKKQFGKGILKWMEDKRMTEAQELLDRKEMRIKEIANALGYVRSSSFSTAFKKRNGMSPIEYRNRRQ